MASSEKEPIATTDGPSIHSSMTELANLDPNDSDPNKTHHLLKHCLSNGQRTEALAYFNTMDVKDAAKEISKMGQRDLQSKFKLVYGTATHSNNNDWLRRKLYEAIGAAPIKAATKNKVRKPPAKARKSSSSPSESHYQVISTTSSLQFAGSFERRSRRAVRGTPKGLALAQTLKTSRRSYSSLPSSPVVGRSVIDMHRYAAHDIATSTSEEETGSMYDIAGDEDREVDDDHEEDRYDDIRGRRRPPSRLPSVSSQAMARHVAAAAAWQDNEDREQQEAGVGIARYASYPPSSSMLIQQQLSGRYAPQQGNFGGMAANHPQQFYDGQADAMPRPASYVGLASYHSSEFFQSDAWCSDAWCSDAWAETVLKTVSTKLAGSSSHGGAMQVSSTVDEEDVVLLPVDLSAFDAAGSLL